MSTAAPALVRFARVEDTPALLGLLEQLGYPATIEEVRGRLERLLADSASGVLVAEVPCGPVGLASFQVFQLIYRPRPECRLTALVVDRGHRRGGIGSRLVDAVEGIGRERGCFRLELNTRPDRSEALPFYTALGFTERPYRLVKPLE